jgi:predicted enzyme related to lactoylglutathione lyase
MSRSSLPLRSARSQPWAALAVVGEQMLASVLAEVVGAARTGTGSLPGESPIRRRTMTATSQSARRTSEFVRGVDFVGIPTRDLRAAAAFYGETLGLPRSVYLEERNYSEFETGNLTLSVYDAEKMGLGHEVNRNPVALHVDDVAATRKLLEERGVRFHGGTIDTGVCHMAVFADPDGNALMLHHRYAPRHAEV